MYVYIYIYYSLFSFFHFQRYGVQVGRSLCACSNLKKVRDPLFALLNYFIVHGAEI